MFLGISAIIDYLHQCISYRYDDGSIDQLRDNLESEDGVVVFFPGDDAMVFYSVDVE